MTAKEATIKLINYRTDRIAEATVALITNFAKYSGIHGTRQWVGGIIRLLEIIENQKPQEFSLNAQGIELSFSGFPNPKPLIRGGELFYEPGEPRYIIDDRGQDVAPTHRTRIARAAEDITDEMADVFHLKVKHPPHTLIFPQDRFVKETIIFRAAIL